MTTEIGPTVPGLDVDLVALLPRAVPVAGDEEPVTLGVVGEAEPGRPHDGKRVVAVELELHLDDGRQ